MSVHLHFPSLKGPVIFFRKSFVNWTRAWWWNVVYNRQSVAFASVWDQEEPERSCEAFGVKAVRLQELTRARSFWSPRLQKPLQSWKEVRIISRSLATLSVNDVDCFLGDGVWCPSLPDGGMVKIQQTWQLGISYYVLGPRPVMYQCIIVNTIMDNRAGEACVTT